MLPEAAVTFESGAAVAVAPTSLLDDGTRVISSVAKIVAVPFTIEMLVTVVLSKAVRVTAVVATVVVPLLD